MWKTLKCCSYFRKEKMLQHYRSLKEAAYLWETAINWAAPWLTVNCTNAKREVFQIKMKWTFMRCTIELSVYLNELLDNKMIFQWDKLNYECVHIELRGHSNWNEQLRYTCNIHFPHQGQMSSPI
jgi:hypothetical protein